MVSIPSTERRKEVCERIKKIRIKHFGKGHGAQKEMARALGIPYTTYRGYEENRTNDEFIKLFANKFNVSPLYILWGDEEDSTQSELASAVIIDPELGVLKSRKYKLLQITDESMEPTIKKGAWVGVESLHEDENINGKTIGFRDTGGKLTIRRVAVKGKTIWGIAENPHFQEMVTIAKKDIIGKVSWQFSRI